MKALSFIESDMEFGPFAEDRCFRIDQSKTFTNCGARVKMADFALVLAEKDSPPRLWMVEAKKSFPNPATKEDFRERMLEICEKLINGLSLTIAACLKRHATFTELPATFRVLDLSNTDFRLALIIKTHERNWLGDVQNILRKDLNVFCRTWGLPPKAVVVLNEDLARKKRLIASV